MHEEIWKGLLADAELAQAEERFDDAERSLFAALELAENSAMAPEGRALTHSNLSALYAGTERFDEALDHARRAVSFIEQAYGASDPRLISPLAFLTLSTLRSRRGDAAPILERIIALLEARPDGTESTRYSGASTGIAEILAHFPELDPLTEKILVLGLADLDSLGASDDPTFGQSVALLAALRHRQGNVGDAILGMTRALEILGDDDDQVAMWSGALGAWLLAEERPAESKVHFERAARLFELEEDPGQASRARYHLAFVAIDEGRLEDAERRLQELRGRMGDDEGEARVLRELAHVFRETNRSTEADELLARADELFPEEEDDDEEEDEEEEAKTH